MATVARIIGGAGTGKTTRLMQIMTKTLESGVRDPFQIGFVSFTRAARREASIRAGDTFGIRPEELEQDGWFRTLHSVCCKVLKISGELIGNSAEDRRWLAEALGSEVEQEEEGSFSDMVFSKSTEADLALALWNSSRNRLVPLRTVWEQAAAIDHRIPHFQTIEKLIDRYEQSKRLGGRMDFSDVLCRFAGKACRVDSISDRDPDGDVPGIPVWMFDECQDSSALLHAVELRLMEHAKWVYMCGDPFQSIFSFNGASSKHFMGVPAAKEEILAKSYRCPAPVHNLGEQILKQCSDYWNRGIASADHPGEVESRMFKHGVADEIDPNQEWLIVARSNYHARRIANILDKRNVPWVPTRGRGGWNAPVRNAGLLALLALQRGRPIDGAEWQQAIKLIPSSVDGLRMLGRGTKTEFSGDPNVLAGKFPWIQISNLESVGASPLFEQMVACGEWTDIIPQSEPFVAAIERWGEDVVSCPVIDSGPAESRRGVRIGTIHSAKGCEANNVVYLTSTSEQVRLGQETDEGYNEERRVEYVACTRARSRLIVAHEKANPKADLPI